MSEMSLNKDENVHKFALRAIRGELLERERDKEREEEGERERKKKIKRESKRERERDPHNLRGKHQWTIK